MRRLPWAAVLLACLTAFGCVQGTQTFTLNPDGSGKVRIDVIMVPPIEFTPTSSGDKKAEKGKKKDESLDQMLAKHVKGFFDAKGVDAWADVSASYAPDGRVKFAGTAYFKKSDKFEITNVLFIGSPIRLAPQPDGSLTLELEKRESSVPAQFGQTGRDEKTPAEIDKMTDAQLDEYILKSRIEYQTSRRIFTALLADARVKMVYLLPGEPAGVRGYQREGRGVAYTLDGNKILTAVNDLYAKDNAELRKYFRSEKAAVSVIASALNLSPDLELAASVPRPTGPQFDYEKEVKRARAAYPELRKRLQLGADVKLPGEAPAEKK